LDRSRNIVVLSKNALNKPLLAEGLMLICKTL
jgi:hypothetical protein